MVDKCIRTNVKCFQVSVYQKSVIFDSSFKFRIINISLFLTLLYKRITEAWHYFKIMVYVLPECLLHCVWM